MKKEKVNNTKVPFSVSLVIPLYNNAQTLNNQLRNCIKIMEKTAARYEILVSNDKSSDASALLLKSFKDNKKIKVFNQKENLGIARNLLFLYKKAKYSYIALFSVDGDWLANDIKRLMLHAYKSKSDIVIGRRDDKDYSTSRKLVSFIYNILPYLLFSVKTYDTGSIKIFKREIIKDVSFHAKTVSFEAEMLIQAVRKGYTLTAITISHKKHHHNKKSSVNIRLISSSFWDLIKLRMKKL